MIDHILYLFDSFLQTFPLDKKGTECESSRAGALDLTDKQSRFPKSGPIREGWWFDWASWEWEGWMLKSAPCQHACLTWNNERFDVRFGLTIAVLFVVFCMIHYMDERTVIIPIASWYPTSSRMVFPELLSRLRKPIYARLPACLLYLFDSQVSFLKRMGAAIESALGLIFLRSSTLNRCWMTKSYFSTCFQ